MPTIHQTQIERLERLLNQPDADSRQSQPAAKAVKRIKILVSAAIAFALFAAINPNFAMLCIGSLIIVALLFLNHSIQRSDPEPKTLVGRIKSLSLVAVAVAGVSAVVGNQFSNIPADSPTIPNFAMYQPQQSTNSDYHADKNLGSTVVGEKTEGLSLKHSAVTGHIDAKSLTSAIYMSMVFDNQTSEQKEARARIALPPEAVVSRVTLWIDGVEQEAAFNSAERVQAAYQWIVNTRRDPVLVTETKKGEVFLQAFPIPEHGEMKVRIGITMPLDVKSRRDFQLVPPYLVSSNFDEKGTIGQVKLESNATIESNLPDQNISEAVKGMYTLTGSLTPDALDKCRFTIHRDSDFSTYASRATHSLEKCYIVESLKQNGNSLKLITKKTLKMPAIPVVNDFSTASRMSTVWAAQEARKCLKLNDIHNAALLGCAYRIVTPATGAVVLESDSDYEYTSLNRNFYSVVSVKTKAPTHAKRKAKPTKGNTMQKDENGIFSPSTVFNSGEVVDAAFINTGRQTSQNSNGNAPVLQGATNGTIGPIQDEPPVLQGATMGGIGPQGGDAFVNTAGTVRVNNLANLEKLLTMLSVVSYVLGIVGGAVLLALGLFKTVTYHQTISRILIGASCLMFGILTPCTINWLVGAAREGNFFG